MTDKGRAVTEFDFRAKEFQRPDIKPEDYEFRADGAIVRKDRWETGMHSVANAVMGGVREWEIPDVVDKVHAEFGRSKIVKALIEGTTVIVRRIPQEDDESLHGNHWTVVTPAMLKRGVSPYLPPGLYEWELYEEGKECGFRIVEAPADDPFYKIIKDEKLQELIDRVGIVCKLVPKPNTSPSFAELRKLVELALNEVLK